MKKLLASLAVMLFASSVSAEIIEIKSTKQFNCLVTSNESVLIMFYRPECPWCRKQTPILKNFDDTHNIKILHVNKNRFPDLAKEYTAGDGVPAFVVTEVDDENVYYNNLAGFSTAKELDNFYNNGASD